ncbi:hypothetical protein BGZ94_009424 [Podila epigama]|nr:hypothetical protein BGZ94_009424 [Podila epigama]
MLLNVTPALQVASVGLASLMLATAAPVGTSKTITHTVKTLACAKVDIPGTMYAGSSSGEHPPTATEGDKLLLTIDVSGCDQSTLQSDKPWSLYIGDAKHPEVAPVMVTQMVIPGKTQYWWEASLPNVRDTDEEPEYYILAQTMSIDGKQRFVGRTEAFAIVEEETNSNDTRMSLARHIIKRDEPQQEQAPLAAAAPEAPPATEVAGAVTGGDPNFKPALAIPQVNVPPPNPYLTAPEPSFPNVPKPPPADPAVLPDPTYPNIRKDGDPLPVVKPGPDGEPKETASDVFFRYAGAGAAILSTVGVGVGGLVGGVVGGAVGLTTGLIAATANSLYYN